MTDDQGKSEIVVPDSPAQSESGETGSKRRLPTGDEALAAIAPEIGPQGFSFVKGGTPTARSEQLYENRYQDAEDRRDIAEKERQLANVPIDQGGAVRYTNQLTATPEFPKAYLDLRYVDRFKQPIRIAGQDVRCCADLIVGLDPSRPHELGVMIVCPRCTQRGHKHQQDNQILIRQSNKWFDFRASMGPATFEFEGKVFRSAGMIMESESFRCPDCDWRARIEHNLVVSD